MGSFTPLLLAISAMVCWGILYFFTAKLSRSVGPLVGLFLFQLVGIPFILVLLPFFYQPLSLQGLGSFAALGIFDMFIWLLFLRAMKIGFVPIVSVLGSTYILVTTALGVIFLNESFSFLKGGSVLIVLMGIIFLSVNIGSLLKAKKNALLRGALPALLSALGVGLYLFLVAPAARSYGWLNSALIIRISIALTAFLILRWRKISVPTAKIPWKEVVGAAVADVIGFTLFNIAVTRYEVSYITIITSSSSLVTVFLSYLFLKEKLTKLQLIGVLFIISGIILLQLR